MRPADLPALPGVLTAAQVAQTAGWIAGVQEPDGAIPWETGRHTDPWNHVESAMALLVGGQVEAAENGYEWLLSTQRADGSWPARTTAGVVDDASGDTNMSAYVAVGIWHHWLVRRDARFVRRFWPVVRRALDHVVALQLPFGGIAWAQSADGTVAEEALLTGSSSILHSLRAGIELAGVLDEPQPGWEVAAVRLADAVREHPGSFLDKATFSMDWYYPVLGGAVRGQRGRARIVERWDDFVVPGLGVRCVDTNPWVTGAETCELALALDALGEWDRARTLVADMQHLRTEVGSYWTGWVFPDELYWPVEQSSWTAAAVLLAVDALTRSTAGSGIFRDAAQVTGSPASPRTRRSTRIDPSSRVSTKSPLSRARR